MKIGKNILLILMTLTICIWGFFSGIDISTYFVLALCTVFVVAAIIGVGGKIEIRRFHILLVLSWAIMFLYANKFTPNVMAYNILFVIFSISTMVFTNRRGIFDENSIIKIIVGFSIFTCAVILAEKLLGNMMTPVFSFALSGDALSTELEALSAGTGYSGFASVVNIVSFATSIVLTYSVYLLKRKPAVKTAFIILDLLVVLLIGERSNLILIPLSIMISYYFITNKGKLTRGFKIVFVMLLFIGIFAMIAPYLAKYQSVKRLVWSVEMFLSGNDIMNGRAKTYTRAIALWKKSPIIGHGWFYFYNNNNGILRRETFSHVHNMVLELLCDCGIVGTLIILAPRVYLYILNIKALGNASAETKDKYAFILAMQTFFYLDSMVHVTFYSIYIAGIYYLLLLYFLMLLKKCAIQEYS